MAIQTDINRMKMKLYEKYGFEIFDTNINIYKNKKSDLNPILIHIVVLVNDLQLSYKRLNEIEMELYEDFTFSYMTIHLAVMNKI